MMGILIHYLSVFLTAQAQNQDLAACIFIWNAPSRSVYVCFQVLFPTVQACNDIIISENTDSAPVALRFGISQGCKHETGSELSADAWQS